MHKIVSYYLLSVDGELNTMRHFDSHMEASLEAMKDENKDVKIERVYAIVSADTDEFHPKARTYFLSYNEAEEKFKKLKLKKTE